MANIMLVANLNCDRILQLDKILTVGGRFHYQDGGHRLGGGGANTGIGLVWAGHHVSLVTEVGQDQIGDWLVAEAGQQGLDCRRVCRRQGATCEMLLVMTPDGERTIIRPPRPKFELPAPPDWHKWQALYINSSAEGAVSWANCALEQTLVLAQLAKDERPRPCHVLIASASDMHGRSQLSHWDYGVSIAGEQLRYFIVTDGEHGADFYDGQQCQHVDAICANLIDATGAGDAYAAGVINGLVAGDDIMAAMQQGAQWAAFAVASASSIPSEQLADYLESR